MSRRYPPRAYRFADQESWPCETDPDSGLEIVVPPFATMQQARRRRNLEDAGQLREIRLSPGWGSEWPLWESIDGPRSPRELGLSDTLAARLKPWTDFWRTVADLSLNQDSSSGPQLPPQWFEAGEILVHAIAVELWPVANVFPQFRNYHRPL
ncbi:hypothetical protein M2390_002263 [Mycetocola sp. BIGb0189]|uniref:hypothetical protein n=1 Tax=Mycetocola sp. BIGb0189 TaxID=2940604 RepID=UPI002167928C|nr:hypothetical protein [Mycetocola sp. BIGb0189]MCS4277069.1 hypothetical protein [Mycetocola sp. BIGb0189]